MTLETAERELLRLYRNAPFLTRAYISIRLRIFPTRSLWPLLMDLSGPVVSVGAGYGLVETMAALANPQAIFLASDAQSGRMERARAATQGIPHIRFEVIDLAHAVPSTGASAILLFDVLHHLPPPLQQSVLEGLIGGLSSGGRIIIKECGIRPRWKLWFNYLTDMVGAPGQPTYPRDEHAWASTLASLGLQTRVTRIDRSSPYVHILIEGTKP